MRRLKRWAICKVCLSTVCAWPGTRVFFETRLWHGNMLGTAEDQLQSKWDAAKRPAGSSFFCFSSVFFVHVFSHENGTFLGAWPSTGLPSYRFDLSATTPLTSPEVMQQFLALVFCGSFQMCSWCSSFSCCLRLKVVLIFYDKRVKTQVFGCWSSSFMLGLVELPDLSVPWDKRCISNRFGLFFRRHLKDFPGFHGGITVQ